MIPKNTKKILLHLLKNTKELGFNINNIAKITNISIGSAFKILKDLEQKKIIKKRQISNASHYNLNLENSETIKLCELILITEKRELTSYSKIYAEDIQKYEDAELIILFGSILQNKDFNDVDVLFITNEIKKTREFCIKLSSIRTKPIIPLILKKEDLIKEIKEQKETIKQIIKNSIILKGESTFMEVIKNAQK